MVLSTLLQNHVALSLLHLSCLILALFLSPENLMVLSSFTSEPTWTSIYLPASEPPGSPIYFRAAWSTLSLLWSHVVSSFLPQNLVVLLSLWLPGLGLNPSAHLPLQPHF